MEEDLNLSSLIGKRFGIEKKDLRTYSPLTLAFVGDNIYELVIRTIIVESGNMSPANLQRKSAGYARATYQAKMADLLLPYLSEEEKDILRRGKNAKVHTRAKNASAKEYHVATGLESLLGYLYLKGRTERILDIIFEGLRQMDKDQEER